jgi:hypothetical protein
VDPSPGREVEGEQVAGTCDVDLVLEERDQSRNDLEEPIMIIIAPAKRARPVTQPEA